MRWLGWEQPEDVADSVNKLIDYFENIQIYFTSVR